MTSEMSNGIGSLRAQINESDATTGFWAKQSPARRLQWIAAGQGLAVLAAMVAVGAGSVQGMHLLATHIDAKPMSPAVAMTVRQGETLWNIASRYGSPSEPQLDRVDTLAKANGLPTSAMLHPGQRLVVPVENPREATRLQIALAMR